MASDVTGTVGALRANERVRPAIGQRLTRATSPTAMLLLLVTLTSCDQDPQWVTGPTTSAIAASASGKRDAEAPLPSAPRAHDMNMTAGRKLGGNFAHDELVVLKPPRAVPDAFRHSLAEIYERYRALRDAFVTADRESINRAASFMRDSVEAKVPGTLPPEIEDAWASHRQVLRTSLHQLSNEYSLEGKRAHLSHATEALYCALKSFGGIDHEVFVLYCPKVHRSHGAYWLSNHRDANTFDNPYGSPGAPRCRGVQETISPAL